MGKSRSIEDPEAATKPKPVAMVSPTGNAQFNRLMAFSSRRQLSVRQHLRPKLLAASQTNYADGVQCFQFFSIQCKMPLDVIVPQLSLIVVVRISCSPSQLPPNVVDDLVDYLKCVRI